jgi:crotonobetainyl-CoA:carnitine CoA-transferase CaiB-like acyl-CoA transferase
MLVSGSPAGRWGNGHANLVPYQLFETSDRSLVIAVGNDAQWRACADALDLELAREPALATNAGRLANRERIVRAMTSRLASRTAAEWRGRLDGAGVPCGLVRTVAEVLASIEGSATTGLPPSVPGSIRRPPPRLGEHSTRVRAVGWRAFE